MSICWATQKDWKTTKQSAFIRNGRLLLEKQIALYDGRCNPIRSFTAEEVKRATNNYDPQKILTCDSGYKLYRGYLQGRPVSIKKFLDNSEQYEYCLNDIVHSSKMSVHTNFMKLLGCCLETQVPILVFEYVGDCTLADRIYGPNKACFQPLLWIHRSKIAMEIANAVAYLHAAFSKPIIFRNIKPLNILLNEYNVAKLSDFGICITIPEGEYHVRDSVIGATGLIAPEYLATGCFNEKQDVFNFGVFLLVLLSGKMVVDVSRLQNGNPLLLADHVKESIEDGRFNEIVDSIILAEDPWPGKQQQLRAFVALAIRCMSESAEDRPSMIEVSKELRQMHYSAISTD